VLLGKRQLSRESRAEHENGNENKKLLAHWPETFIVRQGYLGRVPDGSQTVPCTYYVHITLYIPSFNLGGPSFLRGWAGGDILMENDLQSV